MTSHLKCNNDETAIVHEVITTILTYTPPAVPGSGTNVFESTYNRDRQLTLVKRPDGSSVSIGYDTAGRPSTMTVAAGQYRYGYDPATGLMTTMTAPPGDAIALAYDGSRLTSATWTGSVAGAVQWDYDDDLAMTSEQVVCASATSMACQAVSFGYDDDKLLVEAGLLSLERDAQNGLLVGSSVGVVDEQWQYDEYGDPKLRTVTVNGAALYTEDMTRDAGGRITLKRVTSEGTTKALDFSCDAAGRLADVKTDGALTAH